MISMIFKTRTHRIVVLNTAQLRHRALHQHRLEEVVREVAHLEDHVQVVHQQADTELLEGVNLRHGDRLRGPRPDGRPPLEELHAGGIGPLVGVRRCCALVVNLWWWWGRWGPGPSRGRRLHHHLVQSAVHRGAVVGVGTKRTFVVGVSVDSVHRGEQVQRLTGLTGLPG